MKIYLIGGFLGSGKTTAIKKACQLLQSDNRNVAVITNDQGKELVDTAFLRTANVPIEEVTAGCFCCNYQQLTQAIQLLRETNEPEIIFAESVGSCTDLVATVAKPLVKFDSGVSVIIAVFADAALLLRLITNQVSFLNDQVRYIYKKQLEEANMLIVNKMDLLNAQDLHLIEDVLKTEYPTKTILYQNSLDAQSVQRWLTAMSNVNTHELRQSLELDYEQYAKGEAALAWLDEVLEISTTDKNAYAIALILMRKIEESIRTHFVIGHLKYLLDDGKSKEKFSYTTIENTKSRTSICSRQSNQVFLIINARVQAAPAQVKELIEQAITNISAQTECRIHIRKIAAFQPGYPMPTYRMGN